MKQLPIFILALLLGFIAAVSFASSDEKPLQPGDSWLYSDPPSEFGSAAHIVSVSGATAIVAVRDLDPPPRFVFLKLNVTNLRASLTQSSNDSSAPTTPQSPAFDCKQRSVSDCLETLHFLRTHVQTEP